ncbi:phosphoenolpyruvate-protein phosphotransferase [Mycolicibacterium neworleansense]|uniref:Phosphoenolpyruvate-protein phosphotransferase n=1 Tax=Mycolicibacterium neworleansense TaxID=146018 RepID=A0A0H5RT82_9MYCO|nr:phosphoenolpyruvate-protein phosphotransferase [Mycolicibacterium neworleansense]
MVPGVQYAPVIRVSRLPEIQVPAADIDEADRPAEAGRFAAAATDAGAAAGKPVGVCGEAAADPLLAAVLVGLGVTSLSMAPAAIAAVGARISQVTLQQCRAAADAVLATASAAEAREAALAALS